MKPQNNYLILTWIEKQEEEKTEFGLIMPSVVEDKDTTGWGIVYATCPDSKYKVGQRVVFSKYIPVQFKFENTMYLAVKESDIITIL